MRWGGYWIPGQQRVGAAAATLNRRHSAHPPRAHPLRHARRARTRRRTSPWMKVRKQAHAWKWYAAASPSTMQMTMSQTKKEAAKRARCCVSGLVA